MSGHGGQCGTLSHDSLFHVTFKTTSLNNNLQVWKTDTGGWVWSSPCLFDEFLFVGSYDGHVYCLHQQDGKEAMRLSGPASPSDLDTHADRKVASSPCILTLPQIRDDEGEGQREALVAYCFREGTLVLEKVELGSIKDSTARQHTLCEVLKFQKMIFSSPVMIWDYLLLATRDNHLYCMRIE